MRPVGVLLVLLLVVSACVLVAGCMSPGGNVTPATSPPTGTMAGTPTSAVTTTGTTSSGGGAGQSVTVGLTAQNIAFNTSTITVPAGANVTVNFDNEDAGIPHNFALYDSSAAQNTIFRGEIITGPATTNYTFTAPSNPGTYYFQCDVHPTQMNGQFVVKAGA